jgi:glyoxylase-like metal-dependent hydrolase (beta-lactamase superfamily II)
LCLLCLFVAISLPIQTLRPVAGAHIMTAHMRIRIIAMLLAAVIATAQVRTAREIIKITDDLYRARNGLWYSFFAVTPEGIILADPLSTDFANWLKGQFDEKFPGMPVRYVIYSHSHWDHIEGAAVFGGAARVVAHEGVLRNMDGRYPHMPGDMIDRNNNSQFEVEEILIPAKAHPGICGMPENFFRTHDRNSDGHMTSAEYYSEVRRPDIVYSDRMEISLGGKTVRLIHPGKNHANDGTVLLFPAERVAFSADFPADALVRDSLRSLPSACGNFDQHPMTEWIQSYQAIEALDFDVLAQGHGAVLFKKADVIEARQFFEDLAAAVRLGMSQGKSVDELKQTILLEKYKAWAQYERLRQDNIEAAFNNLKIYR